MNFRIGAHVEATDGRVGEITRVIVEARDRTLSHIVVREGRLRHTASITIPPARWVREHDTARELKITSA